MKAPGSTPSHHYDKFRTKTIQNLIEVPLNYTDHPLFQGLLEMSRELKSHFIMVLNTEGDIPKLLVRMGSIEKLIIEGLFLINKQVGII